VCYTNNTKPTVTTLLLSIFKVILCLVSMVVIVLINAIVDYFSGNSWHIKQTILKELVNNSLLLSMSHDI